MYPYEQGLVNGKWIVGFDGKKHLVQRMTSGGKWATTKKGLDYFRYNCDEYEVKFPIRIAHPERFSKKKSSLTKLFTEKDGEVWRIAKVDPNLDYSTGDIDDKAWKVGAIKGPVPNSRMSLLATDKEKEDHARKQGAQWLQHRGEITGVDTVTREEGKWKVVLNDSPKKLVHDRLVPFSSIA